jgi:hypothetical protein
MAAAAKKAPAKPAAQVSRTTKAPDKTPAPVTLPASSGTTPNGVATAGTPAGNSATLDVAAMGGPAPDVTGTAVSSSGGTSQDDAVYSTGTAYAPQLNYQQQTTYQEIVAQQMGGAGAGTTTGGGQ